MKKNLWILASVAVLIGVSAFLLNRQPTNDGDVTSIESPANSSEKYDAFSDPNVLWGSEDEFHWALEYPPGSIIFSLGLTDLLSSTNETNLVAFTVELMHMCEFRPIDINGLLIPDSLVADDYLIERIQMFNKADNLDRCTELYNEARTYVEDTVSTEEYLSYYYSWKTYDEEFTNQGQESIDKLLTFVGAPKDIQILEEKITRDEIYLLRLPQIIHHDLFNLPS